MDTEKKYDRTIAGSTPGEAVNEICKRLKGASSDPVTYRQTAKGIDFFINKIPVAHASTDSDNPECWSVATTNVGTPFIGSKEEFKHWSRSNYRLAAYNFYEQDTNVKNKPRLLAMGDGLDSAPSGFGKFKQYMTECSRMRNALQKLLSGKMMHYVVQARFTVKYGQRKRDGKRVSYAMHTTFWAGDAMLYEFRSDVKRNASLEERIVANKAKSPTLDIDMWKLLQHSKKNPNAYFTDAMIGKFPELGNALRAMAKVVEKDNKSFPRNMPSPTDGGGIQFDSANGKFALHAIHMAVLEARKTQPKKKRPEAPSRNTKTTQRDLRYLSEEDRRDAILMRQYAQNERAQDSIRRMSDMKREQEAAAASYKNRAISFDEFEKEVEATTFEDLSKLAKGNEKAEELVDELRTKKEYLTPYYKCAYAVLKGRRINEPLPDYKLPCNEIVEAFEDSPDKEMSDSFTNGSVTIHGKALLKMLKEAANGESEKDVATVRKEKREYDEAATIYGDIKREMRRVLAKLGMLEDARLYNEEEDYVTRELVTKGSRTAEIYDEWENAQNRKKQRDEERSNDERERKAKHDKHDDPEGESTVTKGELEDSRCIVERKVPVVFDIRIRALGCKAKDFPHERFYEICMLRPAQNLEKWTWKHVTNFAKRKLDHNNNPKVVTMLQAVKKRGLRLPADYQKSLPEEKPKGKGKSSKPRGQKRRHGGNGGWHKSNGGGSARAARNGGYSRKSAPQTGSTSGLGNSP